MRAPTAHGDLCHALKLPVRDNVLLIGLMMFCMGSASAADAVPSAAEPRFSDYPVAQDRQSHVGAGMRLHLTSPLAKRYATVLRENFKEPANFAGHLRVALWGCGTDCRGFAILDKWTGTAYTVPHVDEIGGVMGNDDERVDFRLNSRLLVISGQLNEDQAPGKFYYLWTGKALKRIHAGPLKIEPIETQ